MSESLLPCFLASQCMSFLRLVAPVITPEVRPSASHGLWKLWKTPAYSASWCLRLQHCDHHRDHIEIIRLWIVSIARGHAASWSLARISQGLACRACKHSATITLLVSTKDTKLCKDVQSATQRNTSHGWNLFRDVRILRTEISAHVKSLGRERFQ